jgi:AcrR family transcriptional regulator
MSTRGVLVAAALEVLERDGEARFSTRAVCAIAEVSAPTLYHHFGNADGLLSAALAEAFQQLIESKKAAIRSSDPKQALGEGWDDYVRFAAEHPRLYAAMMTRVLQGANIPAAEQAYSLLLDRIAAIAATGRLVMEQEEAAQLVWASANAAAMLHVTAAMQAAARLREPSRTVIDGLRECAMQAICRSNLSKERP